MRMPSECDFTPDTTRFRKQLNKDNESPEIENYRATSMESTFSALSAATATEMARTGGGPSLPLLTISKALNRHFSVARYIYPLLLARSSPAVHRLGGFHATRLTSSNSLGYSSALRSLGAVVLPVIQHRLQCLSSSSSSFKNISSGGSGAGFGGYNGGSGGGGGGGSDSGDSKSKLGAAASDSVSLPSSDIIILDVGGMTCGGCSASVKKILESQPQVASASVNLTTETAIVWPVQEAKSVPDWQKSLGETLANHLTNCGFQSTPRGEVPEDIAGEFAP